MHRNCVLRRYIHGPGIDEPITWYEGSGTTTRRFLSADERGSVIAVSDSAGTVLGLNKYDEYGVPQSTNIGKFGYTGQAWLPEVGLWYYKLRAYRPDIGRFLQTDLIGYEDSPNLYAYVLNDPVNSNDPFGLQLEPPSPMRNNLPDPPRSSETRWNSLTNEWEIVVSNSRPTMNDWWKGNTSPVGPDYLDARIYSLSFANSGKSWCSNNPKQCRKKATGPKPRRNTRPTDPPTYDPKINYCGGQGSTRLPNSLGGASINDICYRHDNCFAGSGTPISQCNNAFALEIYFRVLLYSNFDISTRAGGAMVGSTAGYLIVTIFGRKFYVPKN